MKLSSSKRRLAAAALILLALFLIRPGASRLKSRIIYSMSAAVGRPVDIGSVHIRLLPPGFDLNNLAVYDDPGFGAEPMLRASEVTATLRLTSLLRGRMEIARLELTEPSLNLAKREGGRWNFQTILERTAKTPLAPTGKAKSEPRLAFPYIEATSGRINFKNGAEKRPYALTNADFSLWQESDNSWGMRLKGQPFRSDMNLNDMGLLQLSGTWQRSQEIRDTPLQFSVEWNRAQLGQLTKFLSGADQGWRGTMRTDVTLAGTPATLHISANASLDDFRRYDITSGNALHMAASCNADYSSASHKFNQLTCNAPVGDGSVTLSGEAGIPGSGHYSMTLSAENVPANALLMLAQRAKKNIPDDVTGDGILRAKLSAERDESHFRIEGKGEIADVHLQSPSNKADLADVTIPFVVRAAAAGHITARGAAQNSHATGTQLEVGPFAIVASRGRGATVHGWIERTGYTFAIVGDTEVSKFLRDARMIGLPSLSSTADGPAQVDLQVAGTWARSNSGVGADYRGPQVTGTAKLRNVQVAARTFGGPVEVLSAEMQLTSDTVHIGKLNVKAAASTWNGWLQMPRGCGTPASCPVQFALSTNSVGIRNITDWTRSNAKQKPWYRVLDTSERPSIYSTLRAVGVLTTDHLQLHGIDAQHVSANLSLDEGNLRLSSVAADILGGKHRGEWSVDLSAQTPVCKAKGNLVHVSLARVADAMDDPWVSGTADASYTLEGKCSSDFWQSAEGTVKAEITDGSFPHIQLGDNAEIFQITRMSGQAQLKAGSIEISEAKITSPDGVYDLTGSASLERDLDLKLSRVRNNAPAERYSISGTVSEPHLTAVAGAEQARLKSLPTK